MLVSSPFLSLFFFLVNLFICLYLVFFTSYFYLLPKVIGDKKGGNTALLLDKLGALSIIEEINQVVQVPMKFIHVHKNPFDNIATMMLRAIKSLDAVNEEGVKVRRLCFL